MATYETVRPMTQGQLRDIVATMIGGGIPNLSFDEAQGIVGDKGSFVADIRNVFERRRTSTATAKRLHYPDGEVFELTLNGDLPKHQPLAMVKRDGYTGKKHNAPTVKGTETRRFKWVAVGYQPSFDALTATIAPHGKIPEGQWREAVKEMFEPDKEHPRGIADSSWENQHGGASFPYVDSDGSSDFYWISDDGCDFHELWRWLVEVSE